MLTHPTLDQLRALKLDGMVQAFIELEAQEEARNLAHAEWLALLLDREAASQSAANSARVISEGRGDNGDWTMALSSLTLPRIKKPPSRSAAMAGSGVRPSRAPVVLQRRALRPNSHAQRSISGMPILAPPKRCRIWSGSAPMPLRRSSITRATRPWSLSVAVSLPVAIKAKSFGGACPAGQNRVSGQGHAATLRRCACPHRSDGSI